MSQVINQAVIRRTPLRGLTTPIITLLTKSHDPY